MNPADFILARSSDNDAVKVIFGIIVAVFWLIGALASALNKKAKENQRRQASGQLPGNLGAARFPIPAVPVMSQAPAPPTRKKRKVPKLPPTPAQAAPQVQQAQIDAEAPTSRQQQQRSQANLTPANTIGRLPQRPEWLRAAFIMNEVLGPPLSLREKSASKD